MPNNHYQIYVNQLKSELEDEVVGLCFEQGASGVSENLQFTQPDSNHVPDTIETDFKNLVVYFETTPPKDLIERLKNFTADVQLESKPNVDWLEEWKKGYVAFCLVDDIWIVPSWKENHDTQIRPIYMEPGMAFGTGTHETTQVVSELMPPYLQKFDGAKVLDIGTGTGILAMVAALLGAGDVYGVDNDAVAIEVAKDNLRKNHLHKKVKVDTTLSHQIQDDYDVILANIIDGVLLNLKDDIIRLCREGGYAILSGILLERESQFRELFLANQNFELIDRRVKGEWVGLVLKRV